MRRPSISVIMSFIVGVTLGLCAPIAVHYAASHVYFSEQRKDVSRQTSPDGTVDAVLQKVECAVPCSADYFVSIVPKGHAATQEPLKQVFVASEAANVELRWIEPRLLSISYDRALIEDFRNVSYPLSEPGKEASWRYAVEIRLNPTSKFSYLEDKSPGDSRPK